MIQLVWVSINYSDEAAAPLNRCGLQKGSTLDMTWPTIRTKNAPKMRVIIYDDELLFSEALGPLLAMRGLEVMGFPTTTEGALRMVQTVPAHACLVDMSPVVR